MEAEPPDGALEFSGTIFGAYDYKYEEKGAWVGDAILTFGGAAPIIATFVDRNQSLNRKSDGGICGTETITLSFSDGDFEVHARFTGTPCSTAGLYSLHETGQITAGRGIYGHVSGYVVIEGPFLLPDPAHTPASPLWIAEMHGMLQGAPSAVVRG